MGALTSLSKTASSFGLAFSEWALLVFALTVVVGLIGEHKLEWWHIRYKLFALLIAIGCSGELIADGAIFFFSRRLEIISNLEIAQLNLARVQIERQAANRDIAPEDQKTLSDRLTPFAGQKAVIDVYPVTFEHNWVASTILGILTNARWNAREINLLSAPSTHNLANNSLAAPSPFLVQGIWISSTADDRSQSAASALFEALNTTVSPGSMDHVPLPNPEDPRVWIYVGDKPTPLRSWVK
jgi:hypothetical protein